MNFKEQYKRMNDRIMPDRALLEELLREAEEQRNRKENRGKYFLRTLAKCAVTAGAACLCISIAMPVMAANPVIHQLMYQMSPELAQKFVPIQMSDEDQGIRMEVVAVNIHDNEAQIYITLQDLEGDRIDATTDLFDSYYIMTNARSSIGSCSKVGFDEDTGTITYLVTIIEDKKIDKEKVTFSFYEFIGQKQHYENIEIPIPLTEAEENPKTMITALRGRAGNSDWIMNSDGPEKVLVPGQPDERFPVEGMDFTGMGYVDGVLHIQSAAPDNLENDNHGYFSLMDSYGNEVLYDYSISFWGNTEETKTVAYVEEAYLIEPEELPDYTLRGNFWITGIHVKGNWSVTFSLQSNTPQ